ncbi:MAG: DsrH/TusB family sulfur metabolism protein [Promethearchaeota archaeon]
MENKDMDEISIILLQDAIYLAEKAGVEVQEAFKNGIKVYASKRDVLVRGLGKYIQDNVELLDDGDIINKVIECEKLINL